MYVCKVFILCVSSLAQGEIIGMNILFDEVLTCYYKYQKMMSSSEDRESHASGHLTSTDQSQPLSLSMAINKGLKLPAYVSPGASMKRGSCSNVNTHMMMQLFVCTYWGVRYWGGNMERKSLALHLPQRGIYGHTLHSSTPLQHTTPICTPYHTHTYTPHCAHVTTPLHPHCFRCYLSIVSFLPQMSSSLRVSSLTSVKSGHHTPAASGWNLVPPITALDCILKYFKNLVAVETVKWVWSSRVLGSALPLERVKDISQLQLIK